ncbi:MAG: alpha/beta fold hydrolase [Parcubacteria group bacterium]|nr:alpha/beta fold hydrolase [Parcubacteria group bacterium]
MEAAEKYHEIPKPLERQFDERETLDIDGEEIGVIDISPEEVKSETPIVLLPGFGATPETYRELIIKLAETKHRVLSIDAPHGINADSMKDTAGLAEIPDSERRKINAFLTVLEAKKLDRVYVVAHSAAGIYISLAAPLYPEKFRGVLLANPAGMMENDSFQRFMGGFSQEVTKHVAQSVHDLELRRKMRKTLGDTAGVVKHSPMQTIKEGLTIFRARINDAIRKANKKGVRFSLIHGVHDNLFPPRVNEEDALGESRGKDTGRETRGVNETASRDQFVGVYSVKGSHTELLEQPAVYARLFDEALTKLERLEERPKKAAAA